EVWEAGHTYNEELVVDYTDTDWCFRVRREGYRIFAVPKICMPHSLSDSPPVRILGVHLLRYSAVRRYYYFRNTLFFVRQRYVSAAWKRRLLLGLVVRFLSNAWLDEKPLRSIKLSVRGLADGMRGR